MHDADDFTISLQLHDKLLAEANTLNKAVVFEALTAGGVTHVTVEFDGEGDSGQVENITADDDAEVPNICVELQRANWGTGKLDSIRSTLKDAIETLCYDFLSLVQGGWENNDGAFGEFTFHVAERRIEVEFNARFTDSTLFNYSF